MNPREFVEEYCIKSLVCCFSGGKDSLVATHYTLTELQDVNIEKYVVYADTGVMLPGTTEFVKGVCQDLGWNLQIVYGAFFEKAKKWGVPTINRRWCCYEVKLKPIIQFIKTLIPQRGQITGLRQDESLRRSKKSYKEISLYKPSYSWMYNVILDWTDKDVLRYMKQHQLPEPPHYKLGIKETCLCGAFSSKKEMMVVRALFPEFFQKFVELEKNFNSGGSAFYFQGKKHYAKDFLKQKTLDEK